MVFAQRKRGVSASDGTGWGSTIGAAFGRQNAPSFVPASIGGGRTSAPASLGSSASMIVRPPGEAPQAIPRHTPPTRNHRMALTMREPFGNSRGIVDVLKLGEVVGGAEGDGDGDVVEAADDDEQAVEPKLPPRATEPAADEEPVGRVEPAGGRLGAAEGGALRRIAQQDPRSDFEIAGDRARQSRQSQGEFEGDGGALRRRDRRESAR